MHANQRPLARKRGDSDVNQKEGEFAQFRCEFLTIELSSTIQEIGKIILRRMLYKNRIIIIPYCINAVICFTCSDTFS